MIFVAEPHSVVQMFMQLPGVKDVWVVFGDMKKVKTLMHRFLCGPTFPFSLGK